MDSKEPLLPKSLPSEGRANTSQDAQPSSRRSSKSWFHLAAAAFVLSLFWLGRSWKCGHEHREVDTKVPLEIHIMSKCPDARDCLRKLVLPTMANISEKIDFKMSFIGQVSEADDGVQCKHGETECLGNIMMLCAAAEYPSPKTHLGFSYCLINKYEEIPSQSLAEDCALEHDLDFGVLNECMSRDMGDYAMGLLRDSVRHSKAVGAETSCTVRLNNKVRCVFDDGEAKQCSDGSKPGDLIGDIEKLYNEAQGWTY